MKYFLFAILFISQKSFCQADSTMYFKAIGWTINLPTDLKISEETISSENKKGEAVLVQPTTDGKLNNSKPDQSVTLISASKDQSNLFYSNYIVSSKITSSTWEPFDSATKLQFFAPLRKQISTEPEIHFSKIILDGIVFKKLEEKFKISQNTTFSASYLSTYYKHRYLMIAYFFTDREVGAEIENMLKNSKFEK
jgi:hypothetical protein